MNAKPALLDDFLSTEELAAELKAHPITVVRWRLRDEGPPVTRVGRKVLYRRSSVEKWLAAQERRVAS